MIAVYVDDLNIIGTLEELSNIFRLNFFSLMIFKRKTTSMFNKFVQVTILQICSPKPFLLQYLKRLKCSILKISKNVIIRGSKIRIVLFSFAKVFLGNVFNEVVLKAYY